MISGHKISNSITHYRFFIFYCKMLKYLHFPKLCTDTSVNALYVYDSSK